MFHFPAFPPHTLCVQVWVTAHDDCRVSPFGNPRIKAWLTAPRGLSWPPTSFIGSWCQGIHRAPLKTWPQMLASTVQFSNNDQPPRPTAAPTTSPTTTTRQFAHQPRAGTPKSTTSQPYPQTPERRQQPFPQDPTARPTDHPTTASLPHPRKSSTNQPGPQTHRIVNVPPMSKPAPDTRR
jgi:hypothetical protein